MHTQTKDRQTETGKDFKGALNILKKFMLDILLISFPNSSLTLLVTSFSPLSIQFPLSPNVIMILGKLYPVYVI